MKRDLRVSSMNDYVAVDLINESGKIISTPFYLNCKGISVIKYKDDGQVFTVTVAMADNEKQYLLAKDHEGFEFEIPYSELLENHISFT